MACRWQAEPNCSVVGVCVAWVKLIRDCISEAIIPSLVALEAGGLVDQFVSDEAGMGLSHKRVSVLVVGTAVGVRNELGSKRGHQRLTEWEGNVAGGIKGLR